MNARLAAFGIAAGLALAAPAAAQEKQHLSFVLPAGQSRYVQRHEIDAGDVAEHKLRVYELQRTLPKDAAPTIEGARLVELWIRGIADFAGTNGHATAYSTYLFDNGDKLFTRSDIVAVADAGKPTTLAAGQITGGTGKFRSMRGTVRIFSSPDAASGLLRSQFDIDYWFEK